MLNFKRGFGLVLVIVFLSMGTINHAFCQRFRGILIPSIVAPTLGYSRSWRPGDNGINGHDYVKVGFGYGGSLFYGISNYHWELGIGYSQYVIIKHNFRNTISPVTYRYARVNVCAIPFHLSYTFYKKKNLRFKAFGNYNLITDVGKHRTFTVFNHDSIVYGKVVIPFRFAYRLGIGLEYKVHKQWSVTYSLFADHIRQDYTLQEAKSNGKIPSQNLWSADGIYYGMSASLKYIIVKIE